jgi:molybdopterin synthase catalytic subunit
MAIKELEKLCNQVRQKWDVLKIAIVHRIGEVPIGEASVIIVISSAHRRESLEAVHWAIDELKATVPIWKREFYEDGQTSWKQNSECCFTKHNDHSQHQHH